MNNFSLFLIFIASQCLVVVVLAPVVMQMNTMNVMNGINHRFGAFADGAGFHNASKNNKIHKPDQVSFPKNPNSMGLTSLKASHHRDNNALAAVRKPSKNI